MSEINYENLDYGCYIMTEDHGSYTEDVKFATAEYNKLKIQRLRLPDGKGNVVFLLTESFAGCLRMVNSGYFYIPPMYMKLYYPWYSTGTFMGRRYRFTVTKDKQVRNHMITDETRFRPLMSRKIISTTDNTLCCTSDVFDSVSKVASKFTIKRIYTEFYPEFIRIIKSFCPEPDPENTKGNHRILIIDADAFRFSPGAPLAENKTNPLYLLYLAFLREKNLTKWNLDMDMLICKKNMFIKFNPISMNMKNFSDWKRGLFKLMGHNLDDYTDSLTQEEKDEIGDDSKGKTLTNIVNHTIEPFTKMVSTGTKTVLADAIESNIRKKAQDIIVKDENIKLAQKAVADKLGTKVPKRDEKDKKKPASVIRTDPFKSPLNADHFKHFQALSGYAPLTEPDEDDEDYYHPEDDEEQEIDNQNIETTTDDVRAVLTQDEDVAAEVLDAVQDEVVPMKNIKTAPVNSARDQKMREAQKKVVVKNETIEQILARDADNVRIKEEDKSAVMHTSNKNMHNIKFANFDKTYIDELFMRDIVACFDQLKDKESPFYVTSIEVKDTSNTLNFQDTWTVNLVDEVGKHHRIRVDIPKFINDRFMLIGGTKWIILKQNFYNPLVKDTSDTVIVSTNYNKITVSRVATRSLGSVERIFSLIKKTGNGKMFVPGDSSIGNISNKYFINSLEYDELSRVLFKFQSEDCELWFSRDYIKNNLSDQIPSNMRGNEYYIGHEGSMPILINEDTGLDRNGRTISDIIEANLDETSKQIYKGIKGTKQAMYASCKLAGENIPVVAALIVWVGISKALDKMKISWRFDSSAKKVPQNTSQKKYIRFADGVLEYEAKTYAELIMNGLIKMHPENFRFEDFNNEIGYEDYIYSQWGSFNGITEVKAFNEFLVDPITKQTCKNMLLPTDAAGLLINAVMLLADNQHVSKSDDRSYRTRCMEIIPAILNTAIANQYKLYVKSGRRIPMTLNQRCVISTLQKEKTVEAYSTLNPVTEISKAYTITAKGYKGSNSDRSYDEEKRSYDPTSTGKLAISSSPDAKVGVTHGLVVEPTISNARGYRDPVDDVNELKDINIFSPVEMLTPGTARCDDPIRTAINLAQKRWPLNRIYAGITC